jgi:hypothetical protein
MNLQNTSKYIIILVVLLCSYACQKEELYFRTGDLQIKVEEGSAYIHNYKLLLGITKKNPPQMAFWIEDTTGKYLGTIFVTKKIARQVWVSAGGNRRKEALPYWCYSRGIMYSDSLYVPTKDRPVTDGITGETPTESFDIKVGPKETLKKFYVYAEVNHSTDFNSIYKDNIEPGWPYYSGGSEGSGQPAVVYRALVDMKTDSTGKEYTMQLIGHSSPDGSSGTLFTDVSELTSALQIINKITITIR